MDGEPNANATLKIEDRDSTVTTNPSTAINEDPIKVVLPKFLDGEHNDSTLTNMEGEKLIENTISSTAINKNPVMVISKSSLDDKPNGVLPQKEKIRD